MSAVNSNPTNSNGDNGSTAVPKPRAEWLAKRRAQNRDGNFVAPNIETFKAAAAGAQWDKAAGMYLILTDQSGKNSWPISGATFILV